jgi:hypothetical protein
MMAISRRWKFGMIAAALVGITGFGMVKGAQAGWNHGGKHAIMKRFVASAIDDVLEDAKATPQQLATIHAARDRVFTAFENSRSSHKGQIEEALRLFEADRVDEARLATLRTQREGEMKQLGDVVQQALVEAHNTLDAQQRRVVTEHIRSFRQNRD